MFCNNEKEEFILCVTTIVAVSAEVSVAVSEDVAGYLLSLWYFSAVAVASVAVADAVVAVVADATVAVVADAVLHAANPLIKTLNQKTGATFSRSCFPVCL